MNRPWPQVAKFIRSQYNVISEIDFLELDQNPSAMFAKLSSVYKSEYAPEEKILVYHYDTDYYLGDTGFCLHNFLQCLKFLNISPSVIVLLTSHYGIEKEINSFYLKNYTNFDYSVDRMRIFESNYTLLQSTPTPTDADIDHHAIQWPFICLFGAKRVHRVALFSILQKQGLIKQGICAWNSPSRLDYPMQSSNKNLSSNTSVPSLSNTEFHTKSSAPTQSYYCPEFLTTAPFTRINEHWPLSHELSNDYANHGHLYDQHYRHPEIEGLPNQQRFNQPAIKKSFLYVSAETVLQYPYPYLTEKTYRAIIYKRPFVILGAMHSLKLLKHLGFKTFDEYWSEQYDDMCDPNDRILAVTNIITNISSMSVAEMKELCYSMSHILEYNFNHYVNHYAKKGLQDKLEKLNDPN